MSGSYLSIRQFRKAFGAIVAVDDVSLDVKQGEFLTFLGPSGSGKSTTLYAVAGFDDPTGGDILIQGKSILGTAPHRRNIGMVFQRYTLFPHLTVASVFVDMVILGEHYEKRIEKRVYRQKSGAGV